MHRSAACFRVITFSTISLDPASAPRRNPAARILERVNRTTTRPSSSSDATAGTGSPTNRSLRYGMSSTTTRSSRLAMERSPRRFFSDQVIPEGFWKSGTT